MTRIIGSLVVRNEADRYLRDCIAHAQTFLDEIFVYDDSSTDETMDICAEMGCVTVSRDISKPSFIENEGAFRFDAWKSFEESMKPNTGDWVFSFDADEFMVSSSGDVRSDLNGKVMQAQKNNALSVILPFPEIFKIEEDKLFKRVDGLWDTIRGTRLFLYMPGGEWSQKTMGCGSEPTYVARGAKLNQDSLSVLHLGYAKEEDRKSKFKRYTSLDNHGHDNAHVNSIDTKPTLKEWLGPVPSLGNSL